MKIPKAINTVKSLPAASPKTIAPLPETVVGWTDAALLEKLNIESLVDLLNQGFDLWDCGRKRQACDVLIEASEQLSFLFKKSQLTTLAEFDERFFSDYDTAEFLSELADFLKSTGKKDPDRLKQRAKLCTMVLEEFLPRQYGESHENIIGPWRIRLADSYAELKDLDKVNELYTSWLTEEPKWGQGWTEWVLAIVLISGWKASLAQCQNIEKEALSIETLRDKTILKRVLAKVYEENGKLEESVVLLRQVNSELGLEEDRLKGEIRKKLSKDRTAPLALTGEQGFAIGRKEPCPCGSDKKYKRCCGS